MGMVGRPVDRFDAEQRAALVAEHRKLAALDPAAYNDLVMPGGQPGDLQPQLALLAPEPRQRAIGVRLAGEAVGDAARMVGRVLHRFEAGRLPRGVTARERRAIADRR